VSNCTINNLYLHHFATPFLIIRKLYCFLLKTAHRFDAR
jgi:hypothetical protein